MSIIERALRRLQSAQPAPRPGREPAEGPQTAPVRKASPARVVERPRELSPPKESLPTSTDSLRASGVLLSATHTDALADQFRRIKWPLLDCVVGAGTENSHTGNVIMVTSSVSGEGKTFTSLHLALSIAREKDFSVMLIDADVIKRHVTKAFAAEERPGLIDVLSDEHLNPEDLVLGTNIPGLTFLPAGRRREFAPELFASKRMGDVVNTLGAANRRRVILLDSSPLLATNESQVLSRVVDQVVFVVRAESTTQPMVLEAVNLLDRTKLIRCILNQVRASEISEYYYNHGSYKAEEPEQKA